MAEIAEIRRLKAYNVATWRKWGPYLSERQWGTVREDFSESGDAWEYFTHDQARSRAYRTNRLTTIFLADKDETRPVWGAYKKFHNDRHWRNHLNFFEYFNADNGAGLGASHHTGWTGLMAALIQSFGATDSKRLLEAGKPGLVQPLLSNTA